jgi:hypothetical protein
LAPADGFADDVAREVALTLALADAGGDPLLPVAVIAVLPGVPALGVAGVRALCARNGIIA